MGNLLANLLTTGPHREHNVINLPTIMVEECVLTRALGISLKYCRRALHPPERVKEACVLISTKKTADAGFCLCSYELASILMLCMNLKLPISKMKLLLMLAGLILYNFHIISLCHLSANKSVGCFAILSKARIFCLVLAKPVDVS